MMNVKIGIDHGQGFRKIGVQIVDKPEFSNSVSDILLIRVTEVSESRHNLITLLTMPPFVTFFDDPRFTVVLSADLKCLQLLSGMSTGNAKFPCIFCDWEHGDHHDDDKEQSLRTGDSHQYNLNRFMDSRQKASECYNCISESIFDGQTPTIYKSRWVGSKI